MIKSLRFVRKITLLTATTLKIAKKYNTQTMCWLRNQQIRPNQHVVQIGSHPRWFIRNRLQLGITLNNESIFLNYTINVFCQRGIPNKAINTLLFTCRSLNQEILLGRITKTCGGGGGGLDPLLFICTLPDSFCQDLSLLLIVLVFATDSVNPTKLGNRKRTFQRNRAMMIHARAYYGR